MTTDLAGVSQTFTFGAPGEIADPTAPYINSTGSATLALDATNASSIVQEASGAFADAGGTLAVSFEGVGQFFLNGADAYTGSTFLAGTTQVFFSVAGALGSGNIIFSGAGSDPALTSIGPTFTTGQNIDITAGASATLQASQGASLTATGLLTDSGGAGTTLHFGSASGTGVVALDLSAASEDAAGALAIDGGTLKLESASAASLVSALTGGLAVNGTLDLDGQAVTLTALSGAGVINNSAATAATLTFNNANRLVFNGVVSGAIDLNLSGGEVDLLGATVVTSAAIANGAHLKIGNNSAATFSGNVTDNGEFEFDVSGSLTYAQQLSGSGLLRITNGSITLSGDNSGFSGSISLLGQSKISLGNALALGSAALHLNATLESTEDASSNAQWEISGNPIFRGDGGTHAEFDGVF